MGQNFKWLSILGRQGNLYMDQQLKEWKINSSHHMFILHICKNPGITQDKMKSFFCLHPSNVTRALDYLEKEQYIRRETMEEDKRTYRLYPTEKARKLDTEIRKVEQQWENILLQTLEEDQKEEFNILLEQAATQAIDYFCQMKTARRNKNDKESVKISQGV